MVFITSSVYAFHPADDNSIPLLKEARRALRGGQLSWLEYHIPTLPPQRREPLLYVLLSQYYQLNSTMSPSILPWMERLSHERPSLMRTSMINGYQVTHPKFDYPALARAIINRWHSESLTQRYARELRKDRFPWKEIFRADNPALLPQQHSFVRALQALNRAQLNRVRQEIAQHHYYFPDNYIQAILAYKLADPKLLAQLFKQPIDQYSVKTLRQIARFYHPSFARGILMDALKNKDARPFAIDALGQLAHRDHQTLEQLWLWAKQHPKYIKRVKSIIGHAQVIDSFKGKE